VNIVFSPHEFGANAWYSVRANYWATVAYILIIWFIFWIS
jgi:hypothetical protein